MNLDDLVRENTKKELDSKKRREEFFELYWVTATKVDELLGLEEPKFNYYRSKNEKCFICKLEYADHPVVVGWEAVQYGRELHVLCNTDRVRL